MTNENHHLLRWEKQCPISLDLIEYLIKPRSRPRHAYPCLPMPTRQNVLNLNNCGGNARMLNAVGFGASRLEKACRLLAFCDRSIRSHSLPIPCPFPQFNFQNIQHPNMTVDQTDRPTRPPRSYVGAQGTHYHVAAGIRSCLIPSFSIDSKISSIFNPILRFSLIRLSSNSINNPSPIRSGPAQIPQKCLVHVQVQGFIHSNDETGNMKVNAAHVSLAQHSPMAVESRQMFMGSDQRHRAL